MTFQNRSVQELHDSIPLDLRTQPYIQHVLHWMDFQQSIREAKKEAKKMALNRYGNNVRYAVARNDMEAVSKDDDELHDSIDVAMNLARENQISRPDENWGVYELVTATRRVA